MIVVSRVVSAEAQCAGLILITRHADSQHSILQTATLGEILYNCSNAYVVFGMVSTSPRELVV